MNNSAQNTSASTFETSSQYYHGSIPYVHHRIQQHHIYNQLQIDKDTIELNNIDNEYKIVLNKLNEINSIISKQESQCVKTCKNIDIQKLTYKLLQKDINIKLNEIEKSKITNKKYIQKIYDDSNDQNVESKKLEGLKTRICQEINEVYDNLEVVHSL